MSKSTCNGPHRKRSTDQTFKFYQTLQRVRGAVVPNGSC